MLCFSEAHPGDQVTLSISCSHVWEGIKYVYFLPFHSVYFHAKNIVCFSSKREESTMYFHLNEKCVLCCDHRRWGARWHALLALLVKNVDKSVMFSSFIEMKRHVISVILTWKKHVMFSNPRTTISKLPIKTTTNIKTLLPKERIPPTEWRPLCCPRGGFWGPDAPPQTLPYAHIHQRNERFIKKHLIILPYT